MSLTLNDEQEKALREWFRAGRDNDDRAKRYTPVALAQAIAPLMQEWRIENIGYQYSIVGRRHRITVVGPDYGALAQTICDFLNRNSIEAGL